MKFSIDLHQCQNLGQCAMSAPEVFALDDEGQLAFRAEATDQYVSPELSAEQEGAAATASDMCPMQAITLADA